MLTHSQF